MAAITVKGLYKSFEYYKKEPGLKNTFKHLFHRERMEKEAVIDLSFSVAPGEIIGLLGPNGAGKTTTIKLLSGIIYPTQGSIDVLGYTPSERKNDFKKDIAVVMAQKSQLWWDLPASESILINRHIYEMSDYEYGERLSELVDLFDVDKLLPVQVRRLSLGERMKFEIIASLIHNPKVIFLDEPTIGLDLVAQRDMRRFIWEYNKKYGATVILTSHNMQDIENLCNRAVIINHGRKVYDGLLFDVQRENSKKIIFRTASPFMPSERTAQFGNLSRLDNGAYSLQVPTDGVQGCLLHIVSECHIADISVEEEPIEDRIIRMYQEKAREAAV